MGKTIRGENKKQVKQARKQDKEFRRGRWTVIKVEKDED